MKSSKQGFELNLAGATVPATSGASTKIIILSVISLLTGILLLTSSCKNPRTSDQGVQTLTELNPGTNIPADQPGSIKVAEQIIYDVEIINSDPDDPWMTEWLKDLDHKTAVDFIFVGLYQGKFKAFDIFEGNPISISEIKKMETNGDFTREKIGKFQFQEEWILDTLKMTFSKKVTEIRMGLQKFNEDSMLVGYAPLLRVVL